MSTGGKEFATGSEFSPSYRHESLTLGVGTLGEMVPVGGSRMSAAAAMRPEHVPSKIYSGKRVLDLLVALVGIIVTLPFCLLISLAIACTSRGGIFYTQTRLGHGGRPFRCFKFRTMVRDADDRLHTVLASSSTAAKEYAQFAKLRSDPRVTKVGRLLRRWSLDELPQLINVLLGHMSIVGPRPILMTETDRYSSHLTDYMSVRPGITGLWQVSGRCETTFAARVEFDREYIETHSLKCDLSIIGRTAFVMAKKTGAY